MKKVFALVLALMLLMLAMAGCGKNDESTGPLDQAPDFFVYDEQGTMNSFIVYEESGIIVSHQQHISEYYEDGNPRYTQWSLDGILQNESFYEPCENPEYGVYLRESIDYM